MFEFISRNCVRKEMSVDKDRHVDNRQHFIRIKYKSFTLPNKAELNPSVYVFLCRIFDGSSYRARVCQERERGRTGKPTHKLMHSEFQLWITQIASDAFNFITYVLKSRDLNSIWVLKLIAYSWGENFSSFMYSHSKCREIRENARHDTLIHYLCSYCNFYSVCFLMPAERGWLRGR